MKKRFWKIEYSMTILVIFGFLLLLLPTTVIKSKEASYVSKWNETYNKIDYMFTAMTTQADEKILKNFQEAKTPQQKENLMIRLINPYLRISENDAYKKKYKPKFMNGNKISNNDTYYFENFYSTQNGIILSVKDLDNKSIFDPGFIMMFDMNGQKAPNVWGKDIYGINIYADGKIKAIGYNWELKELKKDCSQKGTGVSCSHYYRIGGEFLE